MNLKPSARGGHEKSHMVPIAQANAPKIINGRNLPLSVTVLSHMAPIMGSVTASMIVVIANTSPAEPTDSPATSLMK